MNVSDWSLLAWPRRALLALWALMALGGLGFAIRRGLMLVALEQTRLSRQG